MNEELHEQKSAIDRRRFLKVAAAAAIGGAGVAIFGVAGADRSNAAVAESSAAGTAARMKIVEKYSYKGQTLELMELGNQQMLHLNGAALPDMAFSRTDAGFASHLLPFENFKSSKDLAKKLIDNNGKLFVLSTVPHAM